MTKPEKNQKSPARPYLVGTSPGLRDCCRQRTQLGAGYRGGCKMVGRTMAGGSRTVRMRKNRESHTACLRSVRPNLSRRRYPLSQMRGNRAGQGAEPESQGQKILSEHDAKSKDVASQTALFLQIDPVGNGVPELCPLGSVPAFRLTDAVAAQLSELPIPVEDILDVHILALYI